MTPLEIFLTPGRFLLELFLTGYLHQIPHEIVLIIAAVISWIVWLSLFRIAWAITLKFLGFQRKMPF